MSNLNTLTKRLLELDDRIISCMKCGLCQSVCPMFGSTLEEADVARGKLALIDNLAHHIIKDPDAVIEKLGRCLLCGSCQSNCPSGVDIMDIFLESKELIYEYIGLNPIKKFVFRTMLATPWLFNISMRIGAPLSRLVFWRANKNLGTCKAPLLSPLIGSRHMRPLALKSLYSEMGSVDTPVGESGVKVVFYPGCLGDKLYTDVSKASLKVFDYHGVGVYMPEGFACCGIPALSSGDARGLLKQMKVSLDLLMVLQFDYLITSCSSCTSTIKELWPKYASRLSAEYLKYCKELSAKTIDINSFIINVLKVEASPKVENPIVVTYHDSCHLKKSLGVSSEPREVIGLTGKYELKEMSEADRCCGSGGSFNLFHYNISKDIGMRKCKNINDSGAEIVSMGCPACMMQIEDVISQSDGKVRVKHTVELYAESLK